MRKLQTHDIFAFMRVVKTIGIRDEIKSICLKATNLHDVYEAGFELIFGIIEKCTTEAAEDVLLQFFADIMGEDVQQVKESDPVDFMNKIFEIAEPKKWITFFTQVASLMP